MNFAEEYDTNPPSKKRPFVVKIGGSTLGKGDSTLPDIARLWREIMNVVVVHGGGKAVSEWMRRQGVVPEFVNGLRKTDRQSLDIALAVLGGKINADLVAEFASLGVNAVGISGVGGGTFFAEPIADIGYVGKIVKCDPRTVCDLLKSGAMPVISPAALNISPQGDDDRILNINADTAAGHLAQALKAEKLVFQTDVPGVMDSTRRVIPRLTLRQARELVESGVAVGGMIPKLEACVVAMKSAKSASIIDGRESGSFSDCIAGKDTGTRIT